MYHVTQPLPLLSIYPRDKNPDLSKDSNMNIHSTVTYSRVETVKGPSAGERTTTQWDTVDGTLTQKHGGRNGRRKQILK